jgi:IS5 family transposase
LTGRPPIGLERMLRLHFLQHWFNLSDPAAERGERVPGETTILNFRHLLERHDLTQALFGRMNAYVSSRGLQVRGGLIVDATIIAAPSSDQNRTERHDPEMRQTRKGRQWYFGMKPHIGADSKTKLIHSMTTTAANVHDADVPGELLHGRRRRFTGQADRGQRSASMRRVPGISPTWYSMPCWSSGCHLILRTRSASALHSGVATARAKWPVIDTRVNGLLPASANTASLSSNQDDRRAICTMVGLERPIS